MVAGSRPDFITQNLPFRVRKTIQSIKEIVGNHSDADIYVMLKETNMDPNETTQKLLNQDPFREVKRKSDKKKQNYSYKGPTASRKSPEPMRQGGRSQTLRGRYVWRGSYSRGTLPDAGVSKEFRVVRDNRVNQNANRETKPASQQSSTSTEQVIPDVPEKSSPGIPTDQKHSDARNSGSQIATQHSSEPCDSGTGYGRDSASNGIRKQLLLEVPNSTLRVHGQDILLSQSCSPSLGSGNSVSGIYSSSSDPVHVPSPDSRSTGIVGAIKREVGIVGVRRQSSEQSATRSSIPSNSFMIPVLGKGISTSATSLGPTLPVTKSDQSSQASIHEHVIASSSVSRSALGNQYNGKPHQQILGHQKASVLNMEWKPKSMSQKPSLSSPGVIGTSTAPTSSTANNSASLQVDVARLPEKVSQMNISENQHVIIPNHLRAPEADRTRLTFGSFGADFNTIKSFMPGFQAFGDAKQSKDDPSASDSKLISVEVAASGDVSGEQIDSSEGQPGISGSDSPASAAASQHPLPEEESSSPQNLQNYADIGLVRNDSPPYGPAETQQPQDFPHFPSFPGYDPQTGYDMRFFRPAMDENMRGQELTLTPEALSSHAANSTSPSTIAMVQQQPVTQLYQQPAGVHISHFPNYFPYRQFLSPLYVPPMAVPNFPGSSTYPHPSGGSNYLLMPGGSSHLAAKYAPTQYKPLAAAGYGNYTSPAGYSVSTPITASNATGLEDATRIKYKESNLFVPNRQLTESSEIWVQTPREHPSLQSTTYYNLSGQASHAYVPSHTGHASFNTAQSPHVPFTGLYHPPPPAAMANPHLVHHQQLAGMSGNVAVGVANAAGGQVGSYQQPQLGHLSWTNNF